MFTEVVVTLPVTGRYHYRVPERLAGRACVGARVLVPFGARKITGVVVREDAVPPTGITPIELADVLDAEPSLSRELVELCVWITDYYEASLGEVLKAALPSGSGVEARMVAELTAAGQGALDGGGGALPDKLRHVLASLAGGATAMTGLNKKRRSMIEQLRDRGLVAIVEHRDDPRVRLPR